VSDVNAHKENPIADFREAIRLFLLEHGHSSAGVDVHVDASTKGEYRNRKVLLALPRKSELVAFVKQELGEFLSGIASAPKRDAGTSYERMGIKFSILCNRQEVIRTPSSPTVATIGDWPGHAGPRTCIIARWLTCS
jgi:hypothetical protein